MCVTKEAIGGTSNVGGFREEIRPTIDWGCREETSCTKYAGRESSNEARGKTCGDGGKRNGQQGTKTAQRVIRK